MITLDELVKECYFETEGPAFLPWSWALEEFLASYKSDEEILSVLNELKFRVNTYIFFLEGIDPEGLRREDYDKLKIIEVFIEYYRNRADSYSLKKTGKVDFENKFNHLKGERVYDFFKIELVDRGYISEITLNKFLKMAFEKGELPENKIVLQGQPTSKKIIGIFHRFYQEDHSSYGRKSEYVNLLCNYFDGFKVKSVSENFKSL